MLLMSPFMKGKKFGSQLEFWHFDLILYNMRENILLSFLSDKSINYSFPIITFHFLKPIKFPKASIGLGWEATVTGGFQTGGFQTGHCNI